MSAKPRYVCVVCWWHLYPLSKTSIAAGCAVVTLFLSGHVFRALARLRYLLCLLQSAHKGGGPAMWMGLEVGIVGALPVSGLVTAYIVVTRCSMAAGAKLVERDVSSAAWISVSSMARRERCRCRRELVC
jgi:hypothetical protein